MMRAFTILTEYYPPPLPVRIFDWAAWTDEYGEEGPIGHGASEIEAIASLMEDLGEIQ